MNDFPEVHELVHSNRGNPNRLTLVSHVTREIAGSQPEGSSLTFFQLTSSSEDTYARRTKVGAEWTKVDSGWIDSPGFILIENLEGIGLLKNPSEEERAEIESRVLEISFDRDPKHSIPVPAKGFQPLFVRDLSDLYLRSANGSDIRCKITIYPA